MQEKSGPKLAFREELPDACPPPEAKAIALSGVYRFLPSANPKNEHFDSYCLLKGPKPPPTVTLCQWSACSLFVTREKAVAKIKLQKLRSRFSHFAILDVPANAGYSESGQNGHLSLWMLKHFDPVTAILKIEEIGDV